MPSEPNIQGRRTPILRRQSVVIGHPHIGRGGSEARVMWLIEALKRDFDVTVMTTGGWDLIGVEQLLRNTGSSMTRSRFALRRFPFLVRSLNAAALRGACFQRFARQIAGEYDIRISAYNPTDWGLPALHFIADFSWHQGNPRTIPSPIAGLHLSRYDCASRLT